MASGAFGQAASPWRASYRHSYCIIGVITRFIASGSALLFFFSIFEFIAHNNYNNMHKITFLLSPFVAFSGGTPAHVSKARLPKPRVCLVPILKCDLMLSILYRNNMMFMFSHPVPAIARKRCCSPTCRVETTTRRQSAPARAAISWPRTGWNSGRRMTGSSVAGGRVAGIWPGLAAVFPDSGAAPPMRGLARA